MFYFENVRNVSLIFVLSLIKFLTNDVLKLQMEKLQI
jgi:hypothetical protein